MATKKNKDPKMKSFEHQLSETMQQLGETYVSHLEARKKGAVPAKDGRRLGKSKERADTIVQAAFEDTMRKIQTGEFQDPDKWDYGDGDQSPLPSPDVSAEAQKLRSLWGETS